MQGSNLRPLPCEFTDLNPESRKSTRYAPRLRAFVTQVDRRRQEWTWVRHVLVTVVVTGRMTPREDLHCVKGRHANVVEDAYI